MNLTKTVTLSDREQRLIEHWSMRGMPRISELQFLFMKGIVYMLDEEGLSLELTRLVEVPSLGDSHIVYDFEYDNKLKFSIEIEHKPNDKITLIKPFYLNQSKVLYTKTIKEAIDGYSKEGANE
jgi:hypothetical protein